jgi:hypothetical protein
VTSSTAPHRRTTVASPTVSTFTRGAPAGLPEAVGDGPGWNGESPSDPTASQRHAVPARRQGGPPRCSVASFGASSLMRPAPASPYRARSICASARTREQARGRRGLARTAVDPAFEDATCLRHLASFPNTSCSRASLRRCRGRNQVTAVVTLKRRRWPSIPLSSCTPRSSNW